MSQHPELIALMSAPFYEYQSLSCCNSIRMVELLPGGPDDSIQILLHHRNLSDLPRCSAISYMWGDPSRTFEIFCEGKRIKVTANALLLLQRLRTSKNSQLIWIDGICVNQDNLAERSQQVKLMRDIYQQAETVLVWIGDETEHTKEAFEIAEDLSQGYDYIISTQKIEDDGFRRFKTTKDILELSNLEKLTNSPFWHAVEDVLLSREYFSRLWIVQEIILATNPIVVCGRHKIPWETFYKATRCIWYCHFLQKGGLKKLAAVHIILIGQKKEDSELRQLPVLLPSFSHKQVYDPRDRVYALLGMLSEGSEHKLLEVDYTKPVGKVFQDATVYVILRYQTLDHWARLHFDPTIRSISDAADIPSWVEAFDVHLGRFKDKYPPKLMQGLRLGERKMTIEGDVLNVFGIILDTIEASLANFSASNFKTIVLEIFGFSLSIEAKTNQNDIDAEAIARAAQKTHRLIHPHDIDRFRDEEAFFELVSKWMLTDLGITASSIQQNPHVADLAELYPKLKDAYPVDIASGKRVQDVVSEDKALKWMLDQAERDSGTKYEDGLRWEIYDTKLNVGRNFFLGNWGYCGLGPAGKSGAEGLEAAVQVGDVLALVYGAPVPIILRPRDDGIYIVVGSCHVGNLSDITSPFFRDGKLPEPVILQVR